MPLLAVAPRQNPIFREPDHNRGIEYCPCTIVLSFEIKYTLFERFSTVNWSDTCGRLPAARAFQPTETFCVKCDGQRVPHSPGPLACACGASPSACSWSPSS